jgi:hypothetical protein
MTTLRDIDIEGQTFIPGCEPEPPAPADLAVMAEDIVNIEDRIEKLEAEATAMRESLVNGMLGAGLLKLTTDNGLSVSAGSEGQYHMVDKLLGMDWLKDNGYGHLIQPSVPWQTLNVTLNELVESGKAIPDDVFGRKTVNKLRFNNRSKFLKGSTK